MFRTISAALYLLFLINTTTVWAEAPTTFNYAGNVSVKGSAHEGDAYFKFALVNYDCTDGTSANITNCQTFWSNDGSLSSGTEPGASVKLVVSQGKFTVNLGDTAITNMAAINPDIMQRQLFLRTWFDDGKNNSEQLTPDYQLLSVPYAIHAQTASDSPGVNQTWTDVRANRQAGTIYPNDTARPITVSVCFHSAGANTSGSLFVIDLKNNSVLVSEARLSTSLIHGSSVSTLVPSGHSYKLTTGLVTIDCWSELR